MSTKNQTSDEANDDGAENLLAELKTIFNIYTRELKEWRETGKKGRFLLDEEMFDIVVKLLDKVDKILKLSQKDVVDEPKEGAKLRNIQDFTLGNKK